MFRVWGKRRRVRGVGDTGSLISHDASRKEETILSIHTEEISCMELVTQVIEELRDQTEGDDAITD